jgi:hypothetical protein
MKTDELQCTQCETGTYTRIKPVAPGGGAYYCPKCGNAKPLDAFGEVFEDTIDNAHRCRYREALQYLLDPEGFGLLTDGEVGAYIRKVLDEVVGN